MVKLNKGSGPDPVDKFLSYLDQKNDQGQSTFWKYVPDLFFGPSALFRRAVESSRGNEFIDRLDEVTNLLDGWEVFHALEHRWKLLRALAILRAGRLPEIHSNVTSAVAAFDGLQQKYDRPCGPYPGEEALFRPVLDTYFLSASGTPQEIDWRHSHWQLLDFLAPQKAKMPVVTERTPILLANDNIGKVFILASERSFGPPGLVSPDWWKLGLLPLGEDNNFLTAIHEGFQAVLHRDKERRIRLRWWLEMHPATTTGWFDDLGDDNSSVQVAAACLAMALLCDEPTDLHPFLDDTVAVSARLGGLAGSAGMMHWPTNQLIERVASVQQKTDAARRARLSGVVFASANKPSNEANRANNDGGVPGPVVQYVDTLADAYDSLLITSRAVADYKQKIVKEWTDKWDERPTPEEFTHEAGSSAG
jgi:hypothetical protein